MERKSIIDTNPELLEEWDYEKNNELNLFPKDVTKGQNTKVWWKCKKGHSWLASVGNRARKHTQCPYCSGRILIPGENDLATLFPDLANEWHPTKNGHITPDMIKSRVSTKYWWKCATCGHEWQAAVCNRTRIPPTGCPKCAKEMQTSFPEQAILFFLTRDTHGEVLNRYMYETDDGIFEIDIFLPEINTGIEYNGTYWHNHASKRDLRKKSALENAGVKLISVIEGKEYTIDGNTITFQYNKRYGENLDWTIRKIEEKLNIAPQNIDIKKYQPEILKLYKKIEKERNFFDNYPEIASEWNFEKNGEINPKAFTPHSGKIVWWKCKHGHEWRDSIDHRTCRNDGCPYCSGHRIAKGFNDVATLFPDLVKEWNFVKNNKDISDYLPGSHKKVWWKCEKGHEWQATIASRTGKKPVGCPVCVNKKIVSGINDIATTNPELLKMWDYEKNNALGIFPISVSRRSSKKVWWKCDKCGHEWKTSISNKEVKSCPKCKVKQTAANSSLPKKGNSLEEMAPELAKDFYEERNGISASEICIKSNKKVWWKCQFCGHEWEAAPSWRKKPGCELCHIKAMATRMTIPKPGESLADKFPEIAEEFDVEKNGITAYDVTPKSNIKYWWKCKFCGHEWKVSPNSRKRVGCASCNRKQRANK